MPVRLHLTFFPSYGPSDCVTRRCGIERTTGGVGVPRGEVEQTAVGADCAVDRSSGIDDLLGVDERLEQVRTEARK